MPEGITFNEQVPVCGQEFFSDGKVRLTSPENPAIDPNEGWQIIVDDGQELSHDEDANGVQLVRSTYYALATTKAMSESRFFPDYWTNIQPLTAEEEERITQTIQKQLSTWLEVKMEGEKIG